VLHFACCEEVIMARFDLTDFEWEVILLLLLSKVRGV
jgi:hypothetical protein